MFESDLLCGYEGVGEAPGGSVDVGRELVEEVPYE
jgi:hypothetical protein